MAEKPRLSSVCQPRTAAGSSAPADRYPYSHATAWLSNLMALGSDHWIASLARPALRQHATSSSACRGSAGVAGGRSPQSLAGGPACGSRQLANLLCFQCAMAADPHARRLDRQCFLPGRVAQQRCAPSSGTFYRRGVVDRQYLLDLDDACRSELPLLG